MIDGDYNNTTIQFDDDGIVVDKAVDILVQKECFNLQFVLSNCGHPQLLYENHIFNRNNATKSYVYWRCAHARRLRCKARVITSENHLIPTNTQHTHEPMRRLIYGMGVNNVRNLSRNKKR